MKTLKIYFTNLTFINSVIFFVRKKKLIETLNYGRSFLIFQNTDRESFTTVDLEPETRSILRIYTNYLTGPNLSGNCIFQ